MASSTTKEVERELPAYKDGSVEIELPPLVRVYKDGSVERPANSPYGPPSLDKDPQSKDITISQTPPISARLYLPQHTQPNQKVPILVYFHGGAFCIESAFSIFFHRFINSLVSKAGVLAVSVEYRIAPEHPLPAAYEDCWAAIQWVASHSTKNGEEPWILHHGDFDRLFIGGESAGANIVNNVAIRAGTENLRGNTKILGAFEVHPFFFGSQPIGNETIEDLRYVSLLWDFVYPCAPYGTDNPLINPASPWAASLARLGCSKLLVCIAGKDKLRERGVWYYNLVKQSGWKGQIELFEVEEEDHAFHVFKPDNENSEIMINHLASFLMN